MKRKNPALSTHHFLYGLIKNPKTTAAKHLKSELSTVNQLLDQLPQQSQIALTDLKMDAKMQEWLTMASSNALELGRDKIYEADFLKYLNRFYPQIKLNIPEQNDEDELPGFLEDLNQLADSGKLDPVIGRSSEIRQVMEILCRRTKNNPVLVGPAGVGKTAIVEGLAGLIVKGSVPDIIQGRTIYSLQMGSLLAGTSFRGDFEEKIQTLLNFLKKKGRNVILFIDEIHLLIGAGRTDSGAIDAANLLKPALARGELNCIGATTFGEYKQHIESDSALERRFHRVTVAAPSVEDTIQIIIGLKEKLEIHHGVDITNEAIIAAARLSDQYIADRNLPDKAIDLIDEAAAGLKLSADSPPPKMQELESLIRSKKILASAQEDNPELKKEITELEANFIKLRKTWEQEVLELKKAAQIKKDLDQAQFDFQKKSAEGNYEEASRLKYTIIRDLSEKLDKIKVSWKLTKREIGNVINRRTGIPLEMLLADRQAHLLKLAEFLNKQIMGQQAAITEIADSLIASHAGLTDQTRPLGSFLLLGPSGVGKTETAKQLAYYLFHDDRNLIRIDLSEFRESHSVAKLIGSPPGYVGHEKGGQLTEAVRLKPYSVLLFDEIEKSHPDFGDILLQIMDDGQLTDSQGRTVNFKNTVVLVTSNLNNYEDYLKPELIGRFDAIIRYQRLSKETVKLLVNRELALLNQKLKIHKLTINLGASIAQKIIELGFDERYGARPLKNAFRQLVIKPVSKFIMEPSTNGGNYTIELTNQTVKFTAIKPLANVA